VPAIAHPFRPQPRGVFAARNSGKSALSGSDFAHVCVSQRSARHRQGILLGGSHDDCPCLVRQYARCDTSNSLNNLSISNARVPSAAELHPGFSPQIRLAALRSPAPTYSDHTELRRVALIAWRILMYRLTDRRPSLS
jgi:hypothetical protein